MLFAPVSDLMDKVAWAMVIGVGWNIYNPLYNMSVFNCFQAIWSFDFSPLDEGLSDSRVLVYPTLCTCLTALSSA